MSRGIDIKGIKSVTVRSAALKRKLLISQSGILVFEMFLKNHTKDEVLIVNTNLGMEIYYYSEKDYGDFIQNKLFKFIAEDIDTSKWKIINNPTTERVYTSFTKTFTTFVNYPQLFLAYTKKLIYLKQKHSSSIHIIPILCTFYNDAFERFSKTKRLPHFEKINKVKSMLQQADSHTSILKDLIAEVLMKEHYN